MTKGYQIDDWHVPITQYPHNPLLTKHLPSNVFTHTFLFNKMFFFKWWFTTFLPYSSPWRNSMIQPKIVPNGSHHFHHLSVISYDPPRWAVFSEDYVTSTMFCKGTVAWFCLTNQIDVQHISDDCTAYTHCSICLLFSSHRPAYCFDLYKTTLLSIRCSGTCFVCSIAFHVNFNLYSVDDILEFSTF